ncbi:hypothetical protein WR25_03224 [Diploscapter pachys]|uniref:Uncharacterized protein n=1 Tax=Diploscapter pachys TaxID=2018661 RepID=A0A2A2JQ82_9BILA|nr:hypothetical protein WR25_03224 [Diploscapter pachys]
MDLELTKLKLRLQARDEFSGDELFKVSEFVKAYKEDLKNSDFEDLLILFERTVFLIWQNASFKRACISEEERKLVEEIHQFIGDQGNLGNSDSKGQWLGGSTNNQMASKSRFSRLSLLLKFLTSHILDEENDDILDSFRRNLVSWTERLLEDDESCLALGLILLQRNSKNPNIALEYALALFQSINYDHQLILDWLSSETVAVHFLLAFLKLLASKHEVPNFQNATKRIVELTAEEVRKKKPKIRLNFEENQEKSDENEKISIRITELIGNQEIDRQFEFGLEESTRYSMLEQPTRSVEFNLDVQPLTQIFG